jgi:hypothetical protein
MTADVTYVRARALRWVSDDPFPGLVEVELTDADGKSWRFVDKSPMFDPGDRLRSDSFYPVDLSLACVVVERRADTVTVSTADPWGLEAVDGTFQFVMKTDQVSGNPQ